MNLACEVMKGSSREGRFDVTAGPSDYATLRAALCNWLAANKWDRSRWPEFELHVRRAGESRIIGRIRPWPRP